MLNAMCPMVAILPVQNNSGHDLQLRMAEYASAAVASKLRFLAAGLSREKAGMPVLTRFLARDPSFFVMRPSADGDAGRSPAVLRNPESASESPKSRAVFSSSG